MLPSSFLNTHLAILLPFAVLAISGCSNPEPETNAYSSDSPETETVLFGVYTADKASAVVNQFAPTLKTLESQVSEKLDRPIETQLIVTHQYEEGIQNIVDGKVDFSRLGPASEKQLSLPLSELC